MNRRFPLRCALALSLLLSAAPAIAAGDAVADFYAGHAALQQDEPDNAIAAFSRAIEAGTLEPAQLAYVHHYRAVAFQRLERDQQAIDDYTQALAIGALPKRVQAAVYYNRAIALDRMQNFDRAIKDYTSAIALKPDYSEAYMNRGNAYRKLGDNQMALRDYDASAKYNNPVPHLPHYGRGLVLEQMGDRAGALKAFEAALGIAPEFELARLKVEVYRDAGVTIAAAEPTTKPALGPASGITAATASTNAAPEVAKGNTFVSAVTEPPATTAKPVAEAPKPASAAQKPKASTEPAKPPASQTASAPQKPSVPAADASAIAAGPPAASANVGTAAVGAAVPPPGATAVSAAPVKVASAEPAKLAQPSAPAKTGKAFFVQVAAYKSEASAKSEGARIAAANGAVLAGVGQDVQRADLGDKGVWFRLRFGGFDSKAAADKVCSDLKAKAQACNVVSG